ncbi:MAG: MATE family efflux transporter [Eubacterium sp.]|nr:MATE family efflux transporter [Eubacterium sp.]
MLHGPLPKKMLLFALPIAASSILQQLFNSADIAVVGQFAGSDAQAAVGGNSSVVSLLINLFAGLSVGANVVISNYIGQDRKKEVREAVHTVIVVALISGFAILALGQLVAPPLLRLMDTPENVIDQAVLYLRIYFAGMPFIMFYNFGSAILRSVGDTKKPLYCLMVSGVLNIGLNLLLVIVFQMSVAGVGIATLVSNAVSAAMMFVFLRRADKLIRLDLRRLGIKKNHLLRVIKIGVPAGIQGMVFSLSNVCIQTQINGFGSDAVAGSADAVNFEFFTYFITNAFSQTVVTFTGQNFGANRHDRCKKILALGMMFGLIGTGIMSGTFVLLREYVIQPFTTDPAVIYYAMIRMLHVELLTFMPVIYEVSAAAMRGMGYSMLPAVITIVGTCALRFAWVYTVYPIFNTFEMLMNVYPATWVVTGTAMMVTYFIVRKRAFAKYTAPMYATE